MEPFATSGSSAVSSSLFDQVFQCSGCGASEWRLDGEAVTCECGQRWDLRDGVLSIKPTYEDASTRFYDETGGPRFVGTSFADNVQVYAATRVYLRLLEAWYPKPSGAFLDLGAGDGRVTLWALEKGFHPVVAVDASFPALRRLSAVAQQRGLSGLITIASPIQTAPVRTAAFSAIACIEVLYYLTSPANRVSVLRKIAALLAPDGSLMLSEFTRLGRALADVVAMNLDNLRRTAYQGTRLEKTTQTAVEISHPTPAELAADLRSAGLRAIDVRALSPIPMLFQHAYTFTSYPLRPVLDNDMQALIETLDDQASEPGALARNLVYLLTNDTSRD
jgi:2-polyprenyl-3-methyl-5-hydroxy-6-metoxy-1,4-benzoquinol methylase